MDGSEQSGYESDSNSNITVVSDNSINSRTSDLKGKLIETKERADHYLKEASNTRKDLKSANWNYKTQQNSLLSKLSPEQAKDLKEKDTWFEKKLSDDRYANHHSSGGGLERRLNTADNQYENYVTENTYLKKRHETLQQFIGPGISGNEASRLEEAKLAQINIEKDLFTTTNNSSKLLERAKLIQQEIKNRGLNTESSQSANVHLQVQDTQAPSNKRNIDQFTAEQSQSKKSKSSLIDDYADLSQEPADYMGGDD